jgi:hypothetical protein
MDTSHTITRAAGEHGGVARRRDHLAVFREFLDHLERVSRQSVTTRIRMETGETSRRR